MGTDRSTEFSGLCPCGNGTLQIDYCEVDHGWPTSMPTWYSGHLNCIECSKLYELRELSNGFYLVTKEELGDLESLSKNAHDLEKMLMSSPEINALKNKFVAYINSQKSVAAIYRVLSEFNLVSTAIGTFRNRWNGPENWLAGNLNSWNLNRICEALSTSSEPFSQVLGEIERMRSLASAEPKPFGEVIYKLNA
jgi:hypothetical protein